MYKLSDIPDLNKLSDNLRLTLLGLAVILAVLFGIYIILNIKKMLSDNNDKPQSAEPIIQKPESAINSDDDLELVAVITAAICSATGKKPSEFTVVSFKRRFKR